MPDFPKKFFKNKYLNCRDENINKKTICILNSFKSHLGMLAQWLPKSFMCCLYPFFKHWVCEGVLTLLDRACLFWQVVIGARSGDLKDLND